MNSLHRFEINFVYVDSARKRPAPSRGFFKVVTATCDYTFPSGLRELLPKYCQFQDWENKGKLRHLDPPCFRQEHTLTLRLLFIAQSHMRLFNGTVNRNLLTMTGLLNKISY